MNKPLSCKIWVLKFCLKIIYPKFNVYSFLAFLAIKYRIFKNREGFTKRYMDSLTVKSAAAAYISSLVNSDHNLEVLQNKLLVVSRERLIELSCMNLFYRDHSVLWVAQKLAPNYKGKLLYELSKNKSVCNVYNVNLNFITSEIHKMLWTEDSNQNPENVKIVPVIGSKHVTDMEVLTSESELYNILSCFGCKSSEVEISLHPIPSFDNAPKIASVAEVSLVINEHDLSNDFVKEVLNNHFERPKLISLYDVFSIDLTPETTAHYHYKYLDLVELARKLYFKCNKLESDISNKSSNPHIIPSMFIVKGVTQLTLGEAMHLRKPKEEYFEIKNKTKDNRTFSACPSGLKDKFDKIQEAIHPFITGEINELSSSMQSPIMPILLLTGTQGSGRHLIVKTLAKYNGLNFLQIDCNALQSSTAKQTESKINSMVQKAKGASPAIVLLDNFEVFAMDPENNEDCRVVEYFTNSITELYQNYTKYPIIFIAITTRTDLKPNILRIFLDKFHMSKLNVQQRCDMLCWFASVMQLHINGSNQIVSTLKDMAMNNEHTMSMDVLRRLAAKTETFTYGDLDMLMHFAMRESYLKQCSNESWRDPSLQVVQEEDFNAALESIRSLQSQHLDAPKIPKVYWEDIGGLEKLKKELLKTIELPIKYPHLFKNSSLKRSGILLYGPPGCGKTLVAKAVSTELNVSFLSVKGPELLNMYIGQSEENVRKVFESARASSPCVVFLDELDALAARRGGAGDSGGAGDRVVSQLLAEVDGVADQDADTSSLVFIMGATNRPDLLDQSLLRPGRLDKLVYVGPYDGVDEKTSVLTALCRNYRLTPEVRLASVAAALPTRTTGADLMQVASTARRRAVRSLVHKLAQGTIKESEISQDSIVVGVADFLAAVEAFRSSVSDEEIAYYESLQWQL